MKRIIISLMLMAFLLTGCDKEVTEEDKINNIIDEVIEQENLYDRIGSYSINISKSSSDSLSDNAEISFSSEVDSMGDFDFNDTLGLFEIMADSLSDRVESNRVSISFNNIDNNASYSFSYAPDDGGWRVRISESYDTDLESSIEDATYIETLMSNTWKYSFRIEFYNQSDNGLFLLRIDYEVGNEIPIIHISGQDIELDSIKLYLELRFDGIEVNIN